MTNEIVFVSGDSVNKSGAPPERIAGVKISEARATLLDSFCLCVGCRSMPLFLFSGLRWLFVRLSVAFKLRRSVLWGRGLLWQTSLVLFRRCAFGAKPLECRDANHHLVTLK